MDEFTNSTNPETTPVQNEQPAEKTPAENTGSEYSSSSMNREYATNYSDPNRYGRPYTAPNYNYQPQGTYTYAYQPNQAYGYQQPQNNTAYTSYTEPAAPEKKKKKERKGGAGLVAACAIVGLLSGMGGSVLTRYINLPGTDNAAATAEAGSNSTVLYQQVEGSASEGSKTGNVITDVVSAVKDTVVSITTEEMSTNSFFQQYVETGAGSGVIISEDGYILTCNHVVSGASHITVELANSETYEATVIGTDSKTDLAVLKIEAEGLKAAVMGSSEDLLVGEQVIAIGNPLGTLGNSVSEGIVSAKSREITISGQTMTLLQTDAAVNPGNSGGGLFDSDGYLIGIVNAKSAGEDVEGLGFSIPIDTAKSVAESLIESGYVTGRPALGVQVVTIDDASKASQYGVNRLGVYIAAVNEGSPAERAGLQVGDYIFSADGTLVETYSDLSTVLSNHQIGDTITLQIIRGNQSLNIEVTLGELQA